MKSMELMIQRELQGCLLTKDEIIGNLSESDIDTAQLLSSLDNICQIYPGIQCVQGGARCQRCGNQYNFFTHPELAITYCLDCLNLGRICQQDQLYYFPPMNRTYTGGESQVFWSGELSIHQAKIAKALVDNLNQPGIELVHAVTGSGKTEMIFPLIAQVLKDNGRVCIASPRIDVCLELHPRLSQAFRNCKIKLLYSGSSDRIGFSPICVASTHQLLRFKEAFDLLIVDEVDSFPYVNNPMLHWGVARAVKELGKTVYLTATPDSSLQEAIQKGHIQTHLLPGRYHGHPLPVPQFSWIGNWRHCIIKRKKNSYLWRRLAKFIGIEGLKLIFMPDIALAEALHQWLRQEMPDFSHECVHAQDPLREEKVKLLREGEIQGLITTTILERGVTFQDCHVFVVGSEHVQFNKSSLVQISGRVGRQRDYPKGTLIYGHYGISRNMILAQKEISQMNLLAKERGMIQYD